MRRVRPFLCLLLAGIVLAGCGETRVLEKLGLAVAVGYDDIGHGRLLGTDVFYQIDPNAKEMVTVIAGTAYTAKGIRQSLNRESYKKLVSGQIRVAVYHDKLAQKGILSLVDTLNRDASIGSTVYLTVSKGRASDILSHRYPENSNIGVFLYQAIRQNVNGEDMVSSKLHEFLRDYYASGRDPVMPYIERVGNEVHIDKIALFQDDRMVGEVFAREGFYLKLLRERYDKGQLELSIPFKNRKIFTVIDHISSRKKIKAIDLEKPVFSVKVKLTARIQELSEQIDLSKSQNFKEIQSEIEKAVNMQTQALLQKLNQLHVDPVGFGEIYNIARQKNGLEKVSRDEWHRMVKDAQYQMDVSVKILRTGVVE